MLPRRLAFGVTVATIAAQCIAAAATTDEIRGEVLRYVIDQEDGLPITGAIVVATWRSISRSGYQICNRVESYVSGSDGSFRTPIDPKRGEVILGAYKKGYEWGNSPRGIQMASDGDYRHAQIVHYRWNEANNLAEVIRVEPKIYDDRKSAIEASRERTDAFLRKSRKDSAGRLYELHRLRTDGTCEGGPVDTDGAVPFFSAILEEQRELNDFRAQLDLTVQLAESASKARK